MVGECFSQNILFYRNRNKASEKNAKLDTNSSAAGECCADAQKQPNTSRAARADPHSAQQRLETLQKAPSEERNDRKDETRRCENEEDNTEKEERRKEGEDEKGVEAIEEEKSYQAVSVSTRWSWEHIDRPHNTVVQSGEINLCKLVPAHCDVLYCAVCKLQPELQNAVLPPVPGPVGGQQC